MESGRETNQFPKKASFVSSNPRHGLVPAMPMTLSPFVLSPQVVPLLPTFNMATPSAKELSRLSAPNSGYSVPNDRYHLVQHGIEEVLHTNPSFMNPYLNAGYAPMPAYYQQQPHISIPLPTYNPYAYSAPPQSHSTDMEIANEDSNFEHLVGYAMDRTAPTSYLSRSNEPSSSSTTTVASPSDEERSHNGLQTSYLPLPLHLPHGLSSTPTRDFSSPCVDFSSDMSRTITPQRGATPVENSEASSAIAVPLAEPTNRKKRPHANVMEMDADLETKIGSVRETTPKPKKAKMAAAESPPALASVPMPGIGATRRFGSRLHSLLVWYEYTESQKNVKAKIPSLTDLSDICTDLQTINLKDGFSDATQVSKFVASLRLIIKLALEEPLTKNSLNAGATQSDFVIATHSGLLAAVCMLFLLAHPTFDRKQLTDECLDESCQFLAHTMTGFLYAVITDNTGSLDEFEVTFDAEMIWKPKKPTRKKKDKDLSSWQSGPFASVTTRLITLIYEGMQFLSRLMGSSHLPDEHIIRLLRLARLSLFSHGLSSLQDVSLRIIRGIFLNHPSYRQSMIQDVFEAIPDLSKGNQNPLLLEHGSLHIVTSVLLQMFQSSALNWTSGATTTENEGKETHTNLNVNSKSRPSALSKYFVKTLVDALLERIDAKDDTYALIFDRLVNDLLTCVFRPEWPAAEMLLRDVLHQILTVLHHDSNSGRSNSSNGHYAADHAYHHISEKAKVSLGTWLSLIGTKLVTSKLYMATANLVSRPPPGDAEVRLLQEGSKCPMCTQVYSGKKMASCTRCLRWFHVDCFGIVAAPQDAKSEWLCDACLIGCVSDMIAGAESSVDEVPTSVEHKAKKSKQRAVHRPSVDSDIGAEAKDSIKSLASDEIADGAENSGDSENATELNRVHFAMKVLMLNYLNEVQDEQTLDAKRCWLRNWILELTERNNMQERLFIEQWAPTAVNPFIHLPLGAFRPTDEQLEGNLYIRLLQRVCGLSKIQMTENHKVGLLPSRIALQIFSTRFSLASSSTISIFAYFPKIINQFVTMMNSEHAKTRALALRAITNMVDADMSLLRDKHVYEAVEARLIDPSPLTREKALNMLGRFIIMNPSVVSQYAALIRDRVEDSSISVRRRSVRIIRSVCLMLPGSQHVETFCSALAKRIVRHGEAIKEMVLALFREIWFTPDETKKKLLLQAKEDLMDPELPKADLSLSMTSTESGDLHEIASQPLDTHDKVNQMLAVLKETIRVDPEHDIVWFDDLLTSMKDYSKNVILGEFVQFLVDFLAGIGEEAELEFERQKNCDALVVQHEANPAMKRAAIAAASQNKEELIRKRLLYCVALHQIAVALPHAVCDHFHTLRLTLSTEAPTPSTHALEKKATETLLGIMEAIIPYIRHPSEEIWTSLLKDLSQLLKSHGMPVISASVKCGAAVARRTNANWIKSLYVALANPLKQEVLSKDPNRTPLHTQSVIRFMFTLSMILKCYPLDPPSQIREKDLSTVDGIRSFRYGPHVEEVYHFIVHFWKSNDRDVKTSAVLSLGHLAPGSPGIFVRHISEEIISSALAPSSLEQLKAQGLKTIHEFLSEEAERMKVVTENMASKRSSESNSSRTPGKLAKSTASKTAAGGRRNSTVSNGSQSEESSAWDSDADDASSTTSKKQRKKKASSSNDIDEVIDSEESSNDSPPKRRMGAVRSVSSTDTGLSSTIVEVYIKRILSLGVDRSVTIRNSALALIEQILRMGLTHPAYCVPTLVALETDEVLGEAAHRSLNRMDTARVLNRIAVGIQTSFTFQKTLYRTPKAVRPVILEGGVSNYHSALGRLYQLFATAGRVARNNFLSAAFGLYEAHNDSKTPFDAMFITYLTLLIAQFPYTTQEEALYSVFQTNRFITNLAGSTLTRLKQFYKSEDAKTNNKALPSVSDMNDAIIAWHLLMLKVFFKTFYHLDSDRCRNFMPSDTHATPVSTSVTTVNVQDYLHKINPSFEGFLIDADWAKRPDICKRIYESLKHAMKIQEDDHAKATTGKGRRTSTATQNDDGTTTPRKITPLKAKSRAKTGASAKPRRKSTSKMDTDTDYSDLN